MKPSLILALVLLNQLLIGAELTNPEEHAIIVTIGEGFFDNPPEWTQKMGEKVLEWSNGALNFTIGVNEEGNAVSFSSNGVPMTNARIAKLAALKNLQKIHIGHSGQWHHKEIPMEEFSGAGWEALVDSQVEEVHIGGTQMSQPAELALARMPNLRKVYFNHVPVTAEGIAAISQHPKLESFVVGAQHNTIKGFSWYDALPAVAGIPTLREFGVNELFLTWDNSLAAIADKGKHLKRLVFGRGSVVFPEDVERLKTALPDAEVIIEPYDKAMNGNKSYGTRLKKLMTDEEFARLEQLANANP